jgi:radical SAM superfamily enzyme YgiQ (UPF0313 family)
MVPISLPSIAAVLRKKGHDVKIIDCIADGLGTEDLNEALREFDPDMVILDVSTPTFEFDKKTVSTIKKIRGNCHITAIGTHVTSLPAESLSESLLDSVIRREPEVTSLALADALQDGDSLKDVEGLSFKGNGQIIHNPDRPFIADLDGLPFPARDLIHNEKYTMPVSNQPYTLLISSRGCPYRCIFCTARQYYGQKLRPRSAKNIVDEVEEIINKYGIKDITMWSDTFTVDRDFVVGVCNEIKRRELEFNWMTNSRVDKVDLDLLKLMKSVGCSMVSYGAESAVPEILKNCRKGTTPEQIKNALKWSREAGLETICHIIFGLPGETKETINQTIKFVKKLNPDYVQFYGAIPFPGTEFYEMAVANDWLITKDWSKFEINQAIISTPLLSAEELDKARRQAFRTFYFRPGYVLKRLSKLRTWREWANLPGQAWRFLKEWVWKKPVLSRSPERSEREVEGNEDSSGHPGI